MTAMFGRRKALDELRNQMAEMRGERFVLLNRLETTERRAESFSHRLQQALDAPRNHLDSLVRHRVILHLKTDHSIEGFLTGVYEDCLTLDKAYYLGIGRDGHDLEMMQGEQIVSRSQIAWVQDIAESKAAIER